MKVHAPFRFLTVLLAVTSVALVAIAVMNLRQQRKFHLPTDGVAWVRTPDGVAAFSVRPGSPADRAGIERGDYLLAIDGQPVHRTADAVREIYNLGIWSRATYDLARKGQKFQTQLIIVPQDSSRSIRDYLELTGFLYLLIGGFIFLRRWSAPRSLHFYLFCLASFVLYTFSYTGKLNAFDSTVYWLNVVAMVLQPALFLHFCLVFPEKHRLVRTRRYLIPTIYAPAVLLVLLHVLVMTGVVALPLPLLSVRWILDSAEMGFLGIYFTAGALALLDSYRRASVPLVRQQLKWLTRGALLAVVPFVALYVIPYFLGLGFIPAAWMRFSVFSLVLLPLTFGYAIVRYRLMDVDVIFRRGVAYALATATIMGLYFGLVILFADFFRNTALITTQAGWLFAIIVTALLFQPVVNWIQERLEQFLNRKRYDYRRTLLEFARDLTTEVHTEGLLDQAAERLAVTLGVDRVAIFLADDSGVFRLAKSRGLACPGELDLAFLNPRQPAWQRGFLFFDSVRRVYGYPDSSQAAIEQLGLHYYFPLTIKDRTLGCLGLGKTAEGDFLSSDDVDLLRTISGYISIAIENARLYESLQREALEYQTLKDFSQSIIESIDVGVLACNLEQKIESWNLAMEKIYRMPRSVATGKRLSEIFPPELMAELPAANEPRRELSLYKFRLRTGSDQTLIVNLSTVPLLGKEDEVIGRLLILTDLTDRVNLEDQLLQAEKLSSIGVLAAGVAHEVNTPLAVITSQVQMLIRQTPPEDPRLPTLEKVIKQGFRASEIINSLLKFSRVSGSERNELDLNRVIRETLSLVEPMLRTARIAVNAQLAKDLPLVYGNAGKLQQVFMNLIINARDAMPRGGDLTLVTESENSTVAVEVSDSGVGIPPEHLRKIFDPFFTTKTTSRGTGLGLAVSYGIIHEHSGAIRVESVVGRGTTFRLEFPSVRKAVHAV
jgi:two-component system NtrC family sensor kinase